MKPLGYPLLSKRASQGLLCVLFWAVHTGFIRPVHSFLGHRSLLEDLALHFWHSYCSDLLKGLLWGSVLPSSQDVHDGETSSGVRDKFSCAVSGGAFQGFPVAGDV